MQLFSSGIASSGAHIDLWEGSCTALVYALEGAATICILISVRLKEEGVAAAAAALGASNSSDANNAWNATHNPTSNATWNATASNVSAVGGLYNDDEIVRTARILRLATLAADLLQYALYAPLLLVLYDTLKHAFGVP